MINLHPVVVRFVGELHWVHCKMFYRNTIGAVLSLLIAASLRLHSCQPMVSVPSYFLIGDDVSGSFASADSAFDAPQAMERPWKMLMANSGLQQQRYRKANDDQYGDYGSDYHQRKARKNHRKSAGVSGPVHTYIKTDKNANFKWGVRHFAGRRYAGRR